MEQKLTKFEEKLVDFLIGHYNQRLVTGKLLIKETKRLSKSKNDITSKIKNSIIGFDILSEIIRISNITPNKLSQSPDSENREYIREKYSYLPKHLVTSTLNFNLSGDSDDLEYFKDLQRELTIDIFSIDRLEKILESIFVFHPNGILSKKILDYTRYYNPSEIDSKYYRDDHKKYYHNVASLLVNLGINEIKKNLHPNKDKLLIDNLDFTVNMIRKLDYRVEEIHT